MLSIVLAMGASIMLFGLLGWINRRAVETADRRIAKTYQVELAKPRTQELPKPPPQKKKRPEPPPPKQKLQVRRDAVPLTRRPRVQPLRTPAVDLDLRTLTAPVAANIALAAMLAEPTGAIEPGTGRGDSVIERDHYELSEVDGRPIRTRNVPPIYPQAARRRGLSGWVLVEFVVDEKGRVENPRVSRQEGHAGFQAAAIQAVRKWRFKPATRKGKMVRVRCTVKVDFQLND